MDAKILNPQLAAAETFGPAFAHNGFVQIHDFLHPDLAEKIRTAMFSETPWYLTYRDNAETVRLHARKSSKLGRMQHAQLDNRVYETGQTQPQFYYHNFMFTDPEVRREWPNIYLNSLYDVLNSGEVLAFARAVASREDIVAIDGQATRYHPGHYLGFHSDADAGTGRVCAYMIGFSKSWKPDAGGMLTFFEKSGQGCVGILPTFNTLTVFSVPVTHAVQMVTPVAHEPLLSVAGWFLSEEPDHLKALRQA